MMEITPNLAQPIVDRAIAILNRNINMMNAAGMIVGSGAPGRIGTFHQGAAQVLRSGRPLEISPGEAEQFAGARPGVNLPIRLGNRIAGVVGISGAPPEVRPFGELIREMVQLMLAQAHAAEVERSAALARDLVLRELLTGAGDPPARLIQQARLLGVEPAGSFRVLACEPQRRSQPGEYEWLPALERAKSAAGQAGAAGVLATGPWDGRLVLLPGAQATGTAAAVQGALGPDWAVAAGLPAGGLGELPRSYRSALSALAAGKALVGTGPYLADTLSMEALLAAVPAEEAAHLIARSVGLLPPGGTPQGSAVRQAVAAYVGAGMSRSRAAEVLGIHRHTLGYRLDQAAAATGLDPRTWEGAVRLYLGILLERLFGQDGEWDRG